METNYGAPPALLSRLEDKAMIKISESEKEILKSMLEDIQMVVSSWSSSASKDGVYNLYSSIYDQLVSGKDISSKQRDSVMKFHKKCCG